MEFTKKYLSIILMMLLGCQGLIAQNKSKTGSISKRPSNLNQSAVTLSNARLDACMQKNRRLTDDMFVANNKLSEVANQLSILTGNSEYYKSLIDRTRDSVRSTQRYYKQIEDDAKAQLSVMGDSLAILREFRDKVIVEKQVVANDPNVSRVYDFPADIVRIKMLRKFLDEGTGIVLEKNTDDGFTISKVFKDRIKKTGVIKKEIESKVSSTIRMAPHPFNSDRTMFYAITSIQERIGKKAFEDVTDKVIVKEYDQKLLKFFDAFLIK